MIIFGYHPGFDVLAERVVNYHHLFQLDQKRAFTKSSHLAELVETPLSHQPDRSTSFLPHRSTKTVEENPYEQQG